MNKKIPKNKTNVWLISALTENANKIIVMAVSSSLHDSMLTELNKIFEVHFRSNFESL